MSERGGTRAEPAGTREGALREADRRKDEFLAILAHELRNPLAPISNGLEVIRRAGMDSPVTHDVFEMIERQVRHLVRLLDDLMEVSRVTRGMIELKPERVTLGSVIESALEASQPRIQAAGHHLIASVPPAPMMLDADPVRLAQVFANLLDNAAKYTPSGGAITLSAHAEGTEAVVRVRDTGAGIPAQQLGSIFDLFTRAGAGASPNSEQGGLGVGLTLVRSLVHLHHGSVEAHSEGPGKGSEFVVRLPLARDEPVAATASRRQGSADAAPLLRVLAVDDNRDSADSLGILLRLLGAEADVAYDGAAALAVADRLLPDMVLLDLSMPGMDGFAVARSLRARHPPEALTLVALTGAGREEDRSRALQAGFDQYLVKPVELDSLQELLAELRARPERLRH